MYKLGAAVNWREIPNKRNKRLGSELWGKELSANCTSFDKKFVDSSLP